MIELCTCDHPELLHLSGLRCCVCLCPAFVPGRMVRGYCCPPATPTEENENE